MLEPSILIPELLYEILMLHFKLQCFTRIQTDLFFETLADQQSKTLSQPKSILQAKGYTIFLAFKQLQRRVFYLVFYIDLTQSVQPITHLSKQKHRNDKKLLLSTRLSWQ